MKGAKNVIIVVIQSAGSSRIPILSVNRVMKKRNKKFKDLTGKRFGRLQCLKQIGFIGYHRQWLCKCDCGKEHKTLATNLLSRKIKSCGCLGSSAGKNNINWQGYGDICKRYWSALKFGAVRRGWDFKISIEYAWELFLKQNKKCALTAELLQFGQSHKSKDTQTASLDRIDSSKGYVEGNVQWVHKIVNRLKGELNESELRFWCRKIVEYEK